MNSLGGFAPVLGSMVAVVLGGMVLVAAVMSVGISSIPASAQSSSCGNAVIEAGEDCDPPGSSCTGGTTCAADCTCPTPTTTTLPGCDPVDCNDGDPCTTDSCASGSCVNTPLTGFDNLTCRVDAIGDVLDNTPGDQLGGERLERRLQGRLGKIRAKVDSAQSGSETAMAKRIKKAGKLLEAFIRQVQKGIDKGKIDPVVGQQMVDLATGAVDALEPLRAS